MKDPRCLIGRHDWRLTNVVRYCRCAWPDVAKDTNVSQPHGAADAQAAWCDATLTQRCNRCSASRRLWARRRTPGNPPPWAHARIGGAR